MQAEDGGSNSSEWQPVWLPERGWQFDYSRRRRQATSPCPGTSYTTRLL